ncbi:phospholipase A2 inhibitor and Ly6/PLAUR domain-containing protein-like [Eleutherodactylus coqui]|uniref:phospholipase A2 inhibitor and Ly6/PLAUR domain-containing protein-like n=1 Tax=Eleutherodactylus coqui TaxID=57060 RepID=UPI003463523F
MNVFSIAILIVFCSLLGSAFSYKCLSCSPLNSTVCAAKSIDCPTDQCMTASQNSTYGGKTFSGVSKGCANDNMCGEYGSVSQDPHVKVRAIATCCNGKNCNTDPFHIPNDNLTLNGVRCPSAYCENTTKECKKGLKIVECRGSETCCFDYRGRIQDPQKIQKDYSVKGCNNPMACECNFNCLLQMKEIKREFLECCNKVLP